MMFTSAVWVVCVLCLVGHATAAVPKLDGRWVTRNIDKDEHIEIDVCSVVTWEDGIEHVEIYGRIADVIKSQYFFLYGHYVHFFRVSEYRGHFYGPGYPLFSGPGFDEMENCFYHEFRWKENEIVFRCNFDDYTSVTLHRMTKLKPTNDSCFLLDEEENLMGRYGGGAFDGVACLDQRPNSNNPFRLRMELNGFLESEKATIVGRTYLNGRIASGQLYSNDAPATSHGEPFLILRIAHEIFLIKDFEIHVSTLLDDAPFDKCDFHEYGPAITGTYESPYPGLPEVFVCEWKGYLRIMYGYMGVFIGHYSSAKKGYDAVWVEAGYPHNPKSGEALLHFTQDGLTGVGYTTEKKRYSFNMKRLSRGVFPTHLCLVENFTSNEGHSVAGSWAYPNKNDPDSDSRLSICVKKDEEVTDLPDTDAYSIGHVVGHTEYETYNASYGVGQSSRVGGYEMGGVFREETVASGVFHEPSKVKGFSLSVLSSPNELYNIFIYENEWNSLEGFHRPAFGLFSYKRVDTHGNEEECNYFIDYNSANTLHLTTMACVTTLCLFLITFEW